MDIFALKDRMDYFHKLIQREATGTPCEFAEKMKLKRSQLFNIIDEFRDYGADIGYSRIRQTYFYRNDFEIKIEIRMLIDGEQRKISAGNINYTLQSNFFELWQYNFAPSNIFLSARESLRDL
ncbi:MAG: hypothetical protein LBJ17_08010 [Dysgonamonadaceae bacterium]|jgi:hypothetical protein|nr:hypothetical protein [Dysgonamonadaceae bacterium]